MTILIIAKHKHDFDECVQTYKPNPLNHFHHIRTRNDLFGFQAPVTVRFWGDWAKLPEAPQLAWVADALQKSY